MTHHRRGLRRCLSDDALAEAIEEDYASAGLDARRLALLGFVEKLTLRPAEVVREDVLALRAVDFADQDVLAIVECAAYYAYVNRIAAGLGVELEG